jgi:Dipeptidyl peptidase IV (DPP IV) N-terminal region
LKSILLVTLSTALVCEAKTIQPKQLNDKTPFGFDEIVPNQYGQKGFNGVWISEKEFTYTSNGDFVKYNAETKTTETILSKDIIDQQGWASPFFRVSSDLKKILVRYDQRQIFRHSTVSKFTIVFLDGSEPNYKISNGNEVQIAFFTPNANGLAYIELNNIYYLNFDDFGLPAIITSDGSWFRCSYLVLAKRQKFSICSFRRQQCSRSSLRYLWRWRSAIPTRSPFEISKGEIDTNRL